MLQTGVTMNRKGLGGVSTIMAVALMLFLLIISITLFGRSAEDVVNSRKCSFQGGECKYSCGDNYVSTFAKDCNKKEPSEFCCVPEERFNGENGSSSSGTGEGSETTIKKYVSITNADNENSFVNFYINQEHNIDYYIQGFDDFYCVAKIINIENNNNIESEDFSCSDNEHTISYEPGENMLNKNIKLALWIFEDENKKIKESGSIEQTIKIINSTS